MIKSNVKLRNADGTHRQWLSLPEAQRLEREGKAERISKRKAKNVEFRMFATAKASDSNESAAALTLADMHAVAAIAKQGMGAVDQRWRERLLGWGVIREAIQKELSAGARALHYEENDPRAYEYRGDSSMLNFSPQVA